MKIIEWFDQNIRKPFINLWYKGTFFNACKKGDLSTIENLVNQKGFDPKVSDMNKKTALHYAGTPEVVKKLVEVYNLDINARDKKDNTPLHSAARKAQSEVIKALLDQGADSEARNKSYHTLSRIISDMLDKEQYVYVKEDVGAWNPVYEYVQYNRNNKDYAKISKLEN